MPLLFSYGSLQREQVQLSIFGRPLAGQVDELPRFEPVLVTIEAPNGVPGGRIQYLNATFTGRPGSRVVGTVFEVTDAELSSVDAYEAADHYHRVSITLASGKEAWVYLHQR
jgi:hypothetical protein